MKIPFLSTTFTESGKRAKKRFLNILSDNKKKGIIIPIVFLISIILFEVLISCGTEDLGIIGGADGPTAVLVSSIFNNKTVPEDSQYLSCVPKDNTSLYYDRYLENKAFDVEKGTVLAVIKDTDGVCYVQSSTLSPDAPEGYIKKDLLSFNIPDSVNPFHNNDISKFSVYPFLYDYVEKEFIESNKTYYDNNKLKKINIMSKSYNEESEKYDIAFSYTVEYSNYYKDPDTVEYIKEAKENGNKNYPKLYAEYNAIQTGSSGDRRLVFSIKDGAIDEKTIEMYSSEVPTYPPQWKRIYKFRTLLPENE